MLLYLRDFIVMGLYFSRCFLGEQAVTQSDRNQTGEVGNELLF
jgi:hypothetical protein